MDIRKVATNKRKDIDREKEDFYATYSPHFDKFIKHFISTHNLDLSRKSVLEPCAGNGNMSEILKKYFKDVKSYDLVQRDYKLDGEIDLFHLTNDDLSEFDYIITNPPYKFNNKLTKHFLQIMNKGQKLILLVPISFLETKGRYEIFKDNPPKEVHISTSRILCSKNGNFEKFNHTGSQIYSYVLFEKGFNGITSLYFIPFE